MSALLCRATLLLQKELFKLKQLDIWGISIDIDGDEDSENLYLWHVTMSGLKSTPWQGAELKLRIVFGREFNNTPPQVFFTGVVPLHPNVSASDGRLCLGCLEEWAPGSSSIANVLVSLQQLMSEPCFSDEAWNETAVQVATKTPNKYNQIVLDTVMKSQGECDQSPIRTTTPPTVTKTIEQLHYKAQIRPPFTTPPPPTTKSSEKLSYESYLQGWKTLGTTGHAKKNYADSTLEVLFEGELDFVDEPSLEGAVSEEIYHQLSEHRKLTHGSFKTTTDEKKIRKRAELLRATKVQLLKDIHSNKKPLKSLKVSLPASPVNNSPTNELYDEASQIEVQQLVEWSGKLP